MGLLEGFMGGAGQGLVSASKMAFDEYQNEQKDVRSEQRWQEHNKIEQSDKRQALRFARDIALEHTREDMTAAQQAIAGSKDLTDALSKAATPGAIEIITKMSDATFKNKTFELAQQSANRADSNAAADQQYKTESLGLHRQQAEAQMLTQGVEREKSQMQLDAIKEENALFKEYNDPATTPERKKNIADLVKMKKGKNEDGGKSFSSHSASDGSANTLTNTKTGETITLYSDDKLKEQASLALDPKDKEYKTKLNDEFIRRKRAQEQAHAAMVGQGSFVQAPQNVSSGASKYMQNLAGSNQKSSPVGATPTANQTTTPTEADLALAGRDKSAKDEEDRRNNMERERTSELRGQVGLITSALRAKEPETIEELNARYDNNEFSAEEFKRLFNKINAKK